MNLEVRLGRCEPELCTNTIGGERCCLIEVVDVQTGSGVTIARCDCLQAELVVSASRVSSIHHKKLGISI